MKRLLICILTAYTLTVTATTTSVQPLTNEHWWGCSVGNGALMPFTDNVPRFDLATEDANNQLVPLLLSDCGRYIWSDKPFAFSVTDGIITIEAEQTVEVMQTGNTLRDAYLQAAKTYFPPSGTIPEEIFFTKPQYNTWIELMYDQTQEDILRYAHSIINNGFPAGVLMIDDNWQRYYGNFDFKAECFPNPKAMVDELHQLGFRVMLWICPFVSPDSPEYRWLEQKGWLLRNQYGNPAILPWWNGQSACYDLTNPEAAAYFCNILKNMQTQYGIDGFKFDAGDNHCYNQPGLNAWQADATTVDHTLSWANIGLQFPYNEYRACWKMGGQPLVQRLGDKDYSWEAVQSLIPCMTLAGLLGYAYTCPDMIGGGQFTSFLNINADEFNQSLIVRSTQVHALMPMMQFSVAPWRILNAENLNTVRNMANLHVQMGEYILSLAHEAACTGEPIVRHMEYVFPHQGFAACNDQFMLGNRILVAPVTNEAATRTVLLPKGTWRDEQGKRYKGGHTITIDVPLSRLPYFERIK